ncbi:PKD-like domain-containing protein [Flavobacterium pectinovorum]|uniref:Ig-like domain-containing protein n=1 Tax=Flavobacterium pectinovorum TaxID=29533 RepID=UPI001FAD9C53|nr:PKD-like domain-containing protein [Flavobacterium pectinovorum]MCI9844382.1 T9SS sorting signal type C domain-containing protein [Flavobacterium pectinovorum]
MIKKLLILICLFFSKQQQNTPTFITSKLFSNNAKWLCFAFFVFQIGYGQSCNVVRGGDFPNLASVTTNWGLLTGATTGWYYEELYAAGKIYLEADGIGTTSLATGRLNQNLTGLLGNSLTVSFDLTGQNADRFACGTTAMLDVKVGGVTYMTITNPVSNTIITQNDVQTFNGATFGPANFTILVGANGTLNQTTSVKSGGLPAASLGVVRITMTIPSWTGGTSALLEFAARTPSKTTPETGNCRDTSGADDWILDNISVIASSPTAYTITGVDTCNSPTTIGLANSQLGVNYQLYRGGTTAVGGSVAGTGAPISFGSQNTVGVYTVVATAGATTCTTTMTNSVSINALPTVPTASAQSFCSGATVASLVATAPTSGSVVDWYTAASGGTALAATTTLSSGTYHAQSRNTTTGCVSATRRSVVVTINALPTAPTTSAQSFCSGATVASLVATAPTTGSVVDWYTASSGGSALATTTVLSSTTYYAQSRNTTTGCVSPTRTSAVITINPIPTITTAASTAVVAAVCQSASVQTTTMAYTGTTQSPTSYSIDWTGIADQVSTPFSFAGGGGTVTGIIIPAGTASGTYTGTMTVSSANGCTANKAITLTINANLTPTVSISNSPSGTVCAGTNVTFTATATNQGTTPVYQWKLNGVNVGGNSTTFSSSTLLLNNDVVTCEMTSNANSCLTVNPVTSNAITVASAGPTTTGVTICANGSGTLGSSTTCAAGSAVSTGAQEARTGGQISRTSGRIWADPGNITAAGAPYATLFITTNNAVTNYLTATNYDFSSIPNNATIRGISARIRRIADDDDIFDNSIRLIKAGAIVGDDKSSGAEWNDNSFSIVNFGGTNDLWGTTWDVSDIKDSGFGFALSARSGTNDDRNLSVDYMRITITYTVPGSVNWYTAAADGTLLGSGTPFNPVGVTGSGLPNTATPGTYIFYAACSSNTGCRTPTAFVINSRPTITNTTLTQTICSGGNSTAFTPTSGVSGTTYGWTASATSGVSGFTASGSGDIPTQIISTTGTTQGTVTYVITPTANGCPGTAVNYTILVNPRATVTNTTLTQTICSGGSSTAFTPTSGVSGTTYGWTASATSGVSGFTTSGSGDIPNQAISTTETVQGTVTYVITPTANGCPGTAINYTILVNPRPTTPTIGAITHISCTANTGSVVLGDLPIGDWTINQTGHAAASYDNTVPNTTIRTITGLAAGNYTFTVTNPNGCPSVATATVTILDNSNAWNGSSWSKGVPPDDSMNVIIEAVSPISPFTSDLVACALTINSGVVATVPSGITLTITNEVTVNGSLTFENNASLVQINDVNNNVGSITYKRNSQAMKNFDFTYWSSPVEGQTLYNLSPNTLWDKYLSFTGDVWKEELSASVMQPGIGYIIRVPKPNSTYPNNKDYWTTASYVQQLEFIGKPNNGDITSSQYFEKDKYYLIGNPYPSAMFADAFLKNAHNDPILGGTVYFWTHNTAIKMVNSKLAYVSDDYASYNLTGGVASALSDPNNNNVDLNNDGIPDGADNGKKPTGYIAAGQSFFTSAEGGSGYVVFTNIMRRGGIRNSQFFKPAKTSKSAGFEKNRLWLNMTNTGGAFKQTLIGYIEGATNGYDKSFDGFSFDGNSYIDFYSVNGADNLTIQARALPFNDADLVPLGYRSTIAGDFTIAIDEADGKLATQRIYLEDKQTGTITELTARNYTFTTKKGTFNSRFVLRYTDKTLGTGDFETTDDSVSVMIQKKTITVNSTVENIDKVFIYDLSGKHLYTKDKVNNLELIIEHLPFAQQILLVKVVLDNGYETTRKVIFK